MKHMHTETGHDFLVILDENIVTPFLSLTGTSVTRKTKSHFLMSAGQQCVLLWKRRLQNRPLYHTSDSITLFSLK